MFEVKNLSFQYPSSGKIFSNLCFELPPRGLFHLVGPNGRGKTTLLKIIAQLIIRENVLDPLLNTKTPLAQSLFMMSLSSQLLNMGTLIFNGVVLYFFFDVYFPLGHLIKVIFLNLCFWPIFIALGYLAAAFLLIFRKGSAGLGAVVGTLGILSGAYFPIEVFPAWAGDLVQYLNPMYTLLEQTRLILKTGSSTISYLNLTVLPLILGFLLLALALGLFQLTLKHYKKRGEPLILGR